MDNKLDETLYNDTRLLLRVADAAERLGLSRAMIYRLAAEKELPSVRIGGTIRVPLAALKEWIERRTTGVSAA